MQHVTLTTGEEVDLHTWLLANLDQAVEISNPLLLYG
jgi:hypothetical protein